MGLTPCPGQFSQQGPQSTQKGGMKDLQVWQEGDGKAGLSHSAPPTTELTLSAANMASLSLNSGKT